MATVYSSDGKPLYSVFPTWDAHHYLIQHRAGYSGEEWAKQLARPDWNDHARGELRDERVCDGCLINVARNIVNTGGHGAMLHARAELTRRGIDWTGAK